MGRFTVRSGGLIREYDKAGNFLRCDFPDKSLGREADIMIRPEMPMVEHALMAERLAGLERTQRLRRLTR